MRIFFDRISNWPKKIIQQLDLEGLRFSSFSYPIVLTFDNDKLLFCFCNYSIFCILLIWNNYLLNLETFQNVPLFNT